MSRQKCERALCQNDALVMTDDGFLCEQHAPVDEMRRY